MIIVIKIKFHQNPANFMASWHVFSEFTSVKYMHTMKQILALVTIGIFVSAFSFFSSIDEVITAMKAGNASEIARFFDNTVEINMPDKSNSYSKSQAQLVLKDFFSTSAVKSFEMIHKGENAGSQFCIGTLITKTGTYRTTIFMKQKGDKQLLQGITFE